MSSDNDAQTVAMAEPVWTPVEGGREDEQRAEIKGRTVSIYRHGLAKNRVDGAWFMDINGSECYLLRAPTEAAARLAAEAAPVKRHPLSVASCGCVICRD